VNPWARVRTHPIALALLVFSAYYIGATFGFALKLPSSTPSVMWPPNAILTVALLFTPVRRWPIVLLAALPAHLVIQLRAAWSPSLVAALFLTNCSEAVMAAGTIRLLSDDPARMDTLRRVGVFILGAGLVAPFVSCFLDAAVVATLRGEAYWSVWRIRFFSNVLTELAVVPAIAGVINAGPVWLRGWSRQRWLEAAALTTGFLLVAFLASADPAAILGPARAPLVLFLPFLLWAAVRFGTTGAGLALLSTVVLAVWASVKDAAPSASRLANQEVFALQTFLIVVAIPLLCVAALVEERRSTEHALTERLEFEELLSRLSAAFVHVPGDTMQIAFNGWLERLGHFLDLDGVTLLQLLDGSCDVVARTSRIPGSADIPLDPSTDFPWLAHQLRAERTLVMSDVADLPADAPRDRASFAHFGVGSGVALPLVVGNRVFGGLVLVRRAREAWPETLVPRLRLVAEVFANALARRHAEDSLRTSEGMKSAILSSLSSHVAVLDRDGRIIAVNDSWVGFALAAEDSLFEAAGVGDDYLEICRAAARAGVPGAAPMLTGVLAVLDGTRPWFVFEYSRPSTSGERWYEISAVPLKRPEAGAVVTHTDVTERKWAELDAQRNREDLAHVARVSVMGELAASLAHQLNQPLAGILSNAQAALRFMEARPPDLREVRDILVDIVDDDKRAGAVVHRVRDLLRKGDREYLPLDLNAMIRDVAMLVSSDSIIRNVSLKLDLTEASPTTHGDRVQLQQVMLNLLMNAMEAVSACEDGRRSILVRTEQRPTDVVQVSVVDTGPGIPSGSERTVFEPFYTTKPSGMGMGLSIARSIIEAHGGVIWAAPGATGGAAFRFTLPIALESSV
jgi:two-component system, LuxR family, sensor kinase FixL